MLLEKIGEIIDKLDLPANQFRSGIWASTPSELNRLENEAQEVQSQGIVVTLVASLGLAAGIFVEKFLMNHLPENIPLRGAFRFGLRGWDVGVSIIGTIGLLGFANASQKRSIIQEERRSR